MNKTERKRQGVTVQVTLRDRQPFIPTSGRTEPNASERFSEGGEAGWKSRLVGIEPLSGQQDHSRQSVSIRGYSRQNETKRDDFTIFSYSTSLYQVLTTIRRSVSHFPRARSERNRTLLPGPEISRSQHVAVQQCPSGRIRTNPDDFTNRSGLNHVVPGTYAYARSGRPDCLRFQIE